MNGVSHEFFKTSTPVPSSSTWIKSSEEERINLINSSLKNFSELNKIKICSARSAGQVEVELNETLDSGKRGSLLLDLEAILKKELDNGITIWHIPIGDKNSLRNLRGIEIVIKEDIK